MKYFEDFEVGEKIVTRGRTVTEADIVNFAAFTGDWYGLHTDAEFAKGTRFGERIAHGMLVLSMSTGLWSPEFVSLWAFVAFYGLDGLRFTAPVRIGDTLHVGMEVIETRQKDARGGTVKFKYSVKNQVDEDVLIAAMTLLFSTKED